MVEGAPLLRAYGGKTSIEGSNPSLSAKQKNGALSPVFLLIDSDSIIVLKLIGDSAVPDTRNHRRQGYALFHKIFFADRIVEPRANGDITEFDTLAGWFGGHAGLDRNLKWEASEFKTRPLCNSSQFPKSFLQKCRKFCFSGFRSTKLRQTGRAKCKKRYVNSGSPTVV